MSRKKLIIVGAGFAGINLAKGLAKAPLDIILVDRTNHHLFQPLLYQVATGVLSSADIAIPIRKIFRSQSNVQIWMKEVKGIERRSKELIFECQEKCSFDYLALAIGARHSYFGNESWEQWAPGLKTLREASFIRSKIFFALEQAEWCQDVKMAESWLNFVIVGAGPTGVELAGAIAEILFHHPHREFRRVSPQTAKIFLLEAAPQILPMMPVALAERARRDLERLGVQVITNHGVTNVTSEGAFLKEWFIPSKNVIWAAGTQAPALLKQLGVPLDRQGRVIVKEDLSLPDDPNCFVLGDAAHCLDSKNGRPLPAIAPVAIQQGKYLGKLLQARLNHCDIKKYFVYKDRGMLATIGRFKAIAKIGPVAFAGWPAWVTWSLVHLGFLMTIKNRLVVGIHWLIWMFFKERTSRMVEVTKKAEEEVG